MKISRNRVYSGIIMTLIMLVVAFSCGQGSGSTPENVQEKEEAEQNFVAENPQNVGTESNSPYEVNRSVDLSSLPTVVDLLSSEKTISEIKLSDFGKNVTYIKLENPIDSALLWYSGIAMQPR